MSLRRVVSSPVVASLVFAAVVSFVTLPQSRAADATLPDWVVAAAAAKLPNYPSETNAVVLAEDITYTVDSHGQATERHRKAIKILRPQGRDDAIVHVNYDKDTKLKELHVWSISPDGHSFEVKKDEFLDVSFGEGILYDDEKYRVVQPAGSDPGGIIAYEYVQQMRPYVTETTWEFQDDLPHRDESFTLVLPQGYSYTDSWAHYARMQGADLEKQSYRWQLTNVPATDLEHVSAAPHAVALNGRLTLHYTGPGLQWGDTSTWQGVGQWYQQLLQERIQPTPEIQAKAQELTAGKTDFADKTAAIANFMLREVRYFDVEIGVGGYQPHYAGEIFHNRYGDCKDKATLLSSMLSAVGIHSTLVLVDSRRGAIDPSAPSTYGNHAIAAIEIPQGYQSPRLQSVVQAENGKRYLIFDPTWENISFGQLEDNLQGSYGVLVEGAASQVIQLPTLAPKWSTVRRTGVFELGADGTMNGDVVVKRFGGASEEWRYFYSRADEREQTDSLHRGLAGDFPAFQTSDLKVQNVKALDQDLVTTYHIRVDHFGRTMGSLLMLRPRVLGHIGLPIDTRPRTIPIDMGHAYELTDDFTIKLPPGYTADDLPDPVKLDVDFASYSSNTQINGNTLHYTRTYTVRELTLPADKYPEYKHLAGVIGADEVSNAVLKKQ
ncbi:MAG: DUF3857 and transglutaminase domain-containing protein [Acidobacteriota bacterium]|nr:DUF3857 and transglutaminase domain-containing protein [Acidobacteriota bacterium]